MSRVLNSLYRLGEGEMEEEIPKAGDFSGHEKIIESSANWARKPKKKNKSIVCVRALLFLSFDSKPLISDHEP